MLDRPDDGPRAELAKAISARDDAEERLRAMKQTVERIENENSCGRSTA